MHAFTKKTTRWVVSCVGKVKTVAYLVYSIWYTFSAGLGFPFFSVWSSEILCYFWRNNSRLWSHVSSSETRTIHTTTPHSPHVFYVSHQSKTLFILEWKSCEEEQRQETFVMNSPQLCNMFMHLSCCLRFTHRELSFLAVLAGVIIKT